MCRNISPRLTRGLFLLATLMPVVATPAPYKPSEPGAVLLQIPPSAEQVRRISHAQLNVTQATNLARIFIQRARSTADPRELGYARGVLQPWWNQAEPPNEVLLMRATLRQSWHDFDGALDDLSRVLETQPRNAQAWLTRATILRVQGRYPEAAQACTALSELSDPFVATLCSAAIDGLSGQLTDARARLSALQSQRQTQPAAIDAWYLAERIDMAIRAGDDAESQALFDIALSEYPDDIDIRATHAHWLIAHDQAQKVIEQIPADTQADALRLPLYLAMKATNHPSQQALAAQLSAGFAAGSRRDRSPHRRTQALYLLARGQHLDALRVARENWNEQREPDDARLLLESAARAQQPEAADTVRRWLTRSGLQDTRLEPWL